MARHGRGDGIAVASANGIAIQVDTDRVADFANSVRTNVAGTMDPTAPAVRGTLAGIPFGAANPSAALAALFAQYEKCLSNMNLQVLAIQQCVQVIVDAAAQISAGYESSDAFAKASTADVDTVLQNATRVARAPAPPARYATTPRYQ